MRVESAVQMKTGCSVSKQMLKHYSRIRTDAKRWALEGILAKPGSGERVGLREMAKGVFSEKQELREPEDY
jgi:hypothetical protein